MENKWQDSHIINATKPGKQVSVDQLESSASGLIAQLKGISKTRRYSYVTVFDDNYTRFTKPFLMINLMLFNNYTQMKAVKMPMQMASPNS
jgi:hypothetical protein